MKILIAAITLALATVLVPAPAQAHAGHSYMGWSASRTARHIGCNHFTPTGAGMYNKSGGVCYIKGHRVNVITFATEKREIKWGVLALTGFGPDFYIAVTHGAVVVAKNGNRRAAVLGVKALGSGKVMHG